MTFSHSPVMLSEVVGYFADGGVRKRIIDGTLGGGGHTEALLKALPDVEILGIDRDVAALDAAGARLAPFGKRVHLVRGEYSSMGDLVKSLGWKRVDGVLLDIGVSSPQIDDPLRGFSYRFDGPLDMRMDRRQRLTASVILNTRSEDALTEIFSRYGEERRSRTIARAVVKRRMEKAWSRTGEFRELLETLLHKQVRGRDIPPSMRCFQALRIVVNGELEQLESGLRAATDLLAPAGRLAVISFHSLEDRMVKQFMRFESLDCICPPTMPVCTCSKVPRLKPLTRKPVRPGEAEMNENRRSAPARLRVAERLADREIETIAGEQSR